MITDLMCKPMNRIIEGQPFETVLQMLTEDNVNFLKEQPNRLYITPPDSSGIILELRNEVWYAILKDSFGKSFREASIQVYQYEIYYYYGERIVFTSRDRGSLISVGYAIKREEAR